MSSRRSLGRAPPARNRATRGHDHGRVGGAETDGHEAIVPAVAVTPAA